MKKGLILFFLLTSKILFAQPGQIDSIYFFPLNPNNIDSVYFVADVNIGFQDCVLDTSYKFFDGDTITFYANYCSLTVMSNCSRTDTFNLGVLPSGNYFLNFIAFIGVNNCNTPNAILDASFNNVFSVAPTNGLKGTNLGGNFSVFPNPINNSIVNLKSDTSYPYNLNCYNGLGQEVFEMAGLTGNHTINLPKENGIYFIKIVDHKNQTSILKCLKLQN